jgi:hypothetical protein
MAGPEFKVNTAATKAQAYLDYSSCFSTNKKKELKFDEGDFKSVVKDKTKDKDKISTAELKSMFAITDGQAAQLFKVADTSGKKGGGADGKLGWKELQAAIKTADEADKTFDGLVNFENFQKLVTDPTAPPIKQADLTNGDQSITGKKDGEPGPIDGTDLGVKNDNGDQAITKNPPVIAAPAATTVAATAPAANTNENYSSFKHHQEGGGPLGNVNPWLALGGLAAFLLLLGGSRRC